MTMEIWSQPILKVFATHLANEIERHEALKALKLHEDHLEQLVADRTRELETINRELEAFSYSVSHDLRAPLRSIDGFSQVLLEDYGEQLDDEGKDYLQRVRRASQRMGDLIDDMLQLSRVTRSQLNMAYCNLSWLAEQAMAEPGEHDPGRNISITITPDMKARADDKLMAIMLNNLLGNAWKYTSQKTDAEIAFGIEQRCRSCHNPSGFAAHKNPQLAKHPQQVKIWSSEIRQSIYPDKNLPDIPVFDKDGKRSNFGSITCASCHDPHQWNSRKQTPGKGKNPEGDARTSFLRAGDSKNIVCADCHGQDGIYRYKYFHSNSAHEKHHMFK